MDKRYSKNVETIEELADFLNKEYFYGNISYVLQFNEHDKHCITHKHITEIDMHKSKNVITLNYNKCIEDIIYTVNSLLSQMILYEGELVGERRTCDGYYCNRRFKEAAERIGCITDRKDPYGYYIVSPPQDCIDAISAIKFEDYDYFVRKNNAKKKEGELRAKSKGSNSIKYICPNCGSIVRATRKKKLMCFDCDAHAMFVIAG